MVMIEAAGSRTLDMGVLCACGRQSTYLDVADDLHECGVVEDVRGCQVASFLIVVRNSSLVAVHSCASTSQRCWKALYPS
jgi:hypothetical protein